ncbi:hypothetical protein E2C01_095126 [Portunus trituberculatus]|uniref:Uncharacterized protein n=1 Tax=Portunus trituberculatus TaxID=210409 RepID=A0A5B7K3F3_PORTR|nr:hypothetical protein [Portunus trituberculatus]
MAQRRLVGGNVMQDEEREGERKWKGWTKEGRRQDRQGVLYLRPCPRPISPFDRRSSSSSSCSPKASSVGISLTHVAINLTSWSCGSSGVGERGGETGGGRMRVAVMCER